jgi:competence protein ComEA
LAKIKDCKGKEFVFTTKKKAPPKTPPNSRQKPISCIPCHPNLGKIINMDWRKIISDYFSFNRRERIAILTLIALIIIIFLLPDFIHTNTIKQTHKDSSWVAAMKQLEKSGEEDTISDYKINFRPYAKTYKIPFEKKSGELFLFDPNTITSDEWERLGLRSKTVRTIENYLRKGGHFKTPDDVSKIYGLFPDEYERIKPYIRIGSAEPSVTVAAKDQKVFEYPKHTSHYSIIDINSSDTTAFIALPGIGSKLAQRIVTFRDKLGGFYSVNQVAETFGLADSVFQKLKQFLKVEPLSVKKININTAAVDELKAHPYIRWNIANAILAYRNEHGPFEKLDDVKRVMAITDEVFNKLSPYLRL